MPTTTPKGNLLSVIRELQDPKTFQELTWEGTFDEYLELAKKNPAVTRTAYQRMYDMILSYGTVKYTDHKKEITHYKFFDDPIDGGKDAIYGLDVQLMKLTNVMKAAARRYGPERRVLLLHGPVGSSKSTIARMLKKGIEAYSRTPEGALYTFGWRTESTYGDNAKATDNFDCPMHEDPFKLVPPEFRPKMLELLNTGIAAGDQKIQIEGDLCPACRYVAKDLLRKYQGDWTKVVGHVKVHRLLLSERDRVGIGTFQPKDEKNQDSTELTGDINYRKIAEYGSDSDPRAFNFDGEFNIANRGIVEFIEVLKLDVAFLYDLLGASQEHKIKPKKFAQTDIDEVILGHSVSGHEPLPFRYQGETGWTTMAALEERFGGRTCDELEVLAHDFDAGTTRWTPVKKVIKHRFSGKMLTTDQKWGVVETTPNHSIYDRDGQEFFPEDRHEILAARKLDGFLGETALFVDALQSVQGFVRHEARMVMGGGPMTKPARPGWARLDLPRHATEVRAFYDVEQDREALKDLITVLVWYATEGHCNAKNGGIVITQANPDELERVRAAYARITTGKGSIDAGSKTDSAWRLYCGSQAIAALVKHHCGELSPNKRLPDFLFRLPQEFLQHAFDELMKTDGTRKMSKGLKSAASKKYADNFFEYKTISSMLAAQVGTLASLLGHDYSVYRHERPGKTPAYRVRFCSGDGKRGGRHKKVETRLHARDTFQEFVYDIECEGLHNFVCGIGNVVCHNTNEPEYRKLQNNEFMEALRDRTIKIDVPYITKLKQEIKIYEKDYNAKRILGKHIAPHTIEIAAMWAILTRLEEPKKANLTLVQKLRLYDGKSLPGFTEDNVKELRKEAQREGMEGISPRYVQDKISNALVDDKGEGCVNPFMVLNELESGLKHHGLISSEEQRKRYRELLAVSKQEYDDIVKEEVQRAISADEESLSKLCTNYIDNVKAYTQKEKVRNKYTGKYEEPNEGLMRSIEEKIDIPESRKDDFRREIMNYIGALAIDGKHFDYRTNERLQKALERKLFEDQKDTINLRSLASSVVDKETQAKIDVVKGRMIKNYGYCNICSTDVLNYVASIFARGDIKD